MTTQTSIERVDAYLAEQASLDTLRFITCGSVDDGKSTLIGRMLYEAQLIFDDQVASLQSDSKKMGTQGGDIDFALLVDGLAAEREQGITIDVAYRFFSTDRRKFIVADTPGHEQYTRNMVTGASTADVAVILIDARQGVLPQTRRHSMICSSLGIKHIVVAVNKMDLVDYEKPVFDSIIDDYAAFASQLKFESITPIPMSALKGRNVVKRATDTPWYKGPTLLGYLETVDTQHEKNTLPFRLPVQWVNRPNLDFRGFSGTIESGSIKPGDQIRIASSGATARVKEIILFEDALPSAQTGQAVTLTLDQEIDASRGDLICSATNPCETSDQFQLEHVWMDQESGFLGRSYYLKIGATTVNAQITEIKYKVNINTCEHLAATKLELNDLALVTLKTDKPISYESFTTNPAMGSLILIDRMSKRDQPKT